MSDSEKSNSRLFDLDLLRAIVTVADCGSFTTAAARLHSTQSTVSQKVRRLEEMAGHRLLERGNRDVLPTDAGDTLLGYARRLLALNDELAEALSGATVALTVRIGVPDDFAAGRTTERLAAFNRRYPQVKLEVTSGMSRDLSASYDRGELDLVLLKQRRASREALACWPEKTCWVDSARNPCIDLDPLPIVTFPPRGVYRDEMIAALEAVGPALAHQLHQFQPQRPAIGHRRRHGYRPAAVARGERRPRGAAEERRAAGGGRVRSGAAAPAGGGSDGEGAGARAVAGAGGRYPEPARIRKMNMLDSNI